MKRKIKKPVHLSSLLKYREDVPTYFSEDSIGCNHNCLDESLESNLKKLKGLMGNSFDLVSRELVINREPLVNGVALYLTGLVDENLVSELIIKALVEHPMKLNENGSSIDLLTAIEKQVLNVSNVSISSDWNTIIHALLSGNTILLIDHINQAIIGGTSGGEWRSIEEPTAEITIRGPKDSFNESLKTNITLIRRRIKSPHLRFEKFQLGTITQTDVALVYIDGITDQQLIKEVKERLNRIEIDEILSSANIEELIQDSTFTPFPTILNTERPDIVANTLVEGKVIIIVDGTPFVLIAPTSFSQLFKAAEDYYQRYDFVTLLRVLRYIAFTTSLLGPSIYIALITFHQDLIPTTLVISLAAQREGIPFPAFIEAFIMEFTFEVLREAGIRMPRAIGQAVSIVGALVIGQAAVQAGIVSAAMVIVVAGTAIASFTTPAFNLAVAARILRFGMMVLAATMGLYGIIIGLIILVAHLCSLRSFGYPYLAPFAPFILEDQKEGIFRFPLWTRRKRPRLLTQNRTIKMEQGLKPSPKNRKDEVNDA